MKRRFVPTPTLAAARMGLGIAALIPAMTITGGATDDLIIHDTGRAIVRSELTLNNGNVIIEGGGVMETHTGSVTTATTLEIRLNGLLTGCGTINANIINDGRIEARCGPGTYLVVNGDLTNNGTTLITNGTELRVSGTLANTGSLDTRGGSMTAGTFTNTGVYLFDGTTTNDIEIVSAGMFGADFEVTATTLSTKTYVMELSTSLEAGSWMQVGFPQSGTDGPLTFTHINGGTNDKAFYRIREVPAM